MSGIPTTGGSIFVRLWSNINGAWQGNDYTYTAATLTSPKAVMSSPAPSSTLTGSAIRFTWAATTASAYWLDVGTASGQANLATGSVGTATAKTVSGIPLNGSTIYVMLWSFFGGAWQKNDYTYTAAAAENPKAVMTWPEPSSTLPGSTVRFTWNASGAANYRLDVGTALGQTNLFTGTLGAVASKTVTGLPLTGITLYARLWSFISGAWQFNDYTYTASTVDDTKAQMLNPEPSSTLSTTTVVFTRTGTGASNYWLDAGVQPATGDIFAGSFASGTTLSVPNIPRGSRTIYVRVWTFLAGAWVANEYTYIGPP